MDETTEDTQPATREVEAKSPLTSAFRDGEVYPAKSGVTDADLRFASGDKQTCASSRSSSTPSSLFETVNSETRHGAYEDLRVHVEDNDSPPELHASCDSPRFQFLPSSPSDTASLLSASPSESSPLLHEVDASACSSSEPGVGLSLREAGSEETSEGEFALGERTQPSRDGGDSSLFISFHRLERPEAFPQEDKPRSPSTPEPLVLDLRASIPNRGPSHEVDPPRGITETPGSDRRRSLSSESRPECPVAAELQGETPLGEETVTSENIPGESEETPHAIAAEKNQLASLRAAGPTQRLPRSASFLGEESLPPEVRLTVNLPTQLEGKFQRMAICTLPCMQTFEASSLQFPFSVSLPLRRGFFSRPGTTEDGDSTGKHGEQRVGRREVSKSQVESIHDRLGGRNVRRKSVLDRKDEKKEESKHFFATLIRIVVFCHTSKASGLSPQCGQPAPPLSAVSRETLATAPESDESALEVAAQGGTPRLAASASVLPQATRQKHLNTGTVAYYVTVPLKALLAKGGAERRGTVWLALNRAEGKLAPLTPWQMDFYNEGFHRAWSAGMDLCRPKVSVSFELENEADPTHVPSQQARACLAKRMHQLERELDQVYRQADAEVQRYRHALKAAEEQKGKVTSFLRDFESPAFKQMESECVRLRRLVKELEEAAHTTQSETRATIQKLQHELKTARLLLRSNSRRSFVSPSPSLSSESHATPHSGLLQGVSGASSPPGASRDSDLASVHSAGSSASSPGLAPPLASRFSARSIAIWRKKLSDLEERNAAAKKEIEEAERQKEALRIELHMARRSLETERRRSLLQRKALEECRAQLNASGHASTFDDVEKKDDVRPELLQKASSEQNSTVETSGTSTDEASETGKAPRGEALRTVSSGPSGRGVSAAPPIPPSSHEQRLRSQRLSLGLPSRTSLEPSLFHGDSRLGRRGSLAREASFSSLFPSLAASLTGPRVGPGCGTHTARRAANTQRMLLSRVSKEEKQMLHELKNAALQAVPSLQAIAKAHAVAAKERRDGLAKRSRARQAAAAQAQNSERGQGEKEGGDQADGRTPKSVGLRREETECSWTSEEEDNGNTRSRSSSHSQSRTRPRRQVRISRRDRDERFASSEEMEETFKGKRLQSRQMRRGHKGKRSEKASHEGEASESEDRSENASITDGLKRRLTRPTVSCRGQGKRTGLPKRPVTLAPVSDASGPAACEAKVSPGNLTGSARSSLGSSGGSQPLASRDESLQACMEAAGGRGTLRLSIQSISPLSLRRVGRNVKRTASEEALRRRQAPPSARRGLSGLSAGTRTSAAILKAPEKGPRLLKLVRKGARGRANPRGISARKPRSARPSMRICRLENKSTVVPPLAKAIGRLQRAEETELGAPEATGEVGKAAFGSETDKASPAEKVSSITRSSGHRSPADALERRQETGVVTGEEKTAVAAVSTRRLGKKAKTPSGSEDETQRQQRGRRARDENPASPGLEDIAQAAATPASDSNDKGKGKANVFPEGLMHSLVNPRFTTHASMIGSRSAADGFKVTPLSPALDSWSPISDGLEERGDADLFAPFHQGASSLSATALETHRPLPPSLLGLQTCVGRADSRPDARSTEQQGSTRRLASVLFEETSLRDTSSVSEELRTFLEATRALEEEIPIPGDGADSSPSSSSSRPSLRWSSLGFQEEACTLEKHSRSHSEAEDNGGLMASDECSLPRQSGETDGGSTASFETNAQSAEGEGRRDQNLHNSSQGSSMQRHSGTQTVAGAALQRIALRVRAEEAASRERERKAKEKQSPTQVSAPVSSTVASSASHTAGVPMPKPRSGFEAHPLAGGSNCFAAKAASALSQPLPASRVPVASLGDQQTRVQGLPRQQTSALDAARTRASPQFSQGVDGEGRASEAPRSVLCVGPAQGVSAGGVRESVDNRRNLERISHGFQVGNSLIGSVSLAPPPRYLSIGRDCVVPGAESSLLTHGLAPPRTTLRQPSGATLPLRAFAPAVSPLSGVSVALRQTDRASSPPLTRPGYPLHAPPERASLQAGCVGTAGRLGGLGTRFAAVQASPALAPAAPVASVSAFPPVSVSLSAGLGSGRFGYDCMRDTASSPPPLSAEESFPPLVPISLPPRTLQPKQLSAVVGTHRRPLEKSEGRATAPWPVWGARPAETEKQRGVFTDAVPARQTVASRSSGASVAESGRTGPTETERTQAGEGTQGRELPSWVSPPCLVKNHLFAERDNGLSSVSGMVYAPTGNSQGSNDEREAKKTRQTNEIRGYS
ncbi:hypothetical protein TGGT1_285650 [Toxoplasma gondii GT1]|uniref:Uncharacterized protein n=4 Tax=Toxoplasma gondii TaxID=5811 RepID=S7UNP1_TOXGG|nr:hypothetical protein TGGT1_285650 [Toxoplasma gondii GT1]KAF4643882.1 hypothetical protein TGRH88_026380 [Toxoplasma gondii]KFG54713.1 hypothetical protein TGFOU_285650 [Toxoplasma gondii FOU]PUA87984.1 hypothetical protein TGBR9_285650 [Toxoplasma gondii TgCATBr9]